MRHELTNSFRLNYVDEALTLEIEHEKNYSLSAIRSLYTQLYINLEPRL